MLFSMIQMQFMDLCEKYVKHSGTGNVKYESTTELLFLNILWRLQQR